MHTGIVRVPDLPVHQISGALSDRYVREFRHIDRIPYIYMPLLSLPHFF